MNGDEVISGLEKCAAAECNEKCPYNGINYGCRPRLMLDAMELLKEQEPLEPTRVKIDQAGPLYHRCYCKKCGHHVGNMVGNKVTDVHENYCSNCGHEVKWDENP